MSYNLFHCAVCGLPVNIESSNIRRRVVIWVKAKGTTSDGAVVEELHRYRHEFCKPDDVEYLQPKLF